MAYLNNQYIRLDISLEEIAKIEIKTDGKNKLIEDIEIGDYVNVVIANGKQVEYDNIYGGIKILITDEEALKKNEYKIPEYIEKIIVYGCVYDNNKREIEGLKNGLKLINAIKDKNEELTLELLEREEIHDPDGACRRIDHVKHGKSLCHVNQVNRQGYTSLNWACYNNMTEVALKLLEREDINVNQITTTGYTALIYACRNKMDLVALKLLEREDININQANDYGNIALMFASGNKMELVALKLLEREGINVNQVNKHGKTALDYANENQMESVIKRINKINNK
jgi:hypothetical protein